MQKNRRIESEQAMLEFGHALAAILLPGDVLALTGDLGAGKTTLSRGIIQKLCGDIEVPSPTYTLVQTYDLGEHELWHCDLYRLKHPDEVEELGLLDAMEDAVCLIEWPERMGDLMPDRVLTVKIGFDIGSGEHGRTIECQGNEAWQERLANV